MELYYQGIKYQSDIPKDTKFFKLTRKHYPDKLILIFNNEDKKLVKIKDLKCLCEERSYYFNQHHLTPASRGGETLISNLLKLDLNRHNAWHLLFGNNTLREIIELLEKLEQIKLSQKKEFYL